MLVEFEGYFPRVAPTAFVAPTATLIGNVTVSDGASIWFGAVLRGDQGESPIIIGARSNVQDNCVIHVSHDRGTIVGEDVTVGHGAILEGCDIDDRALIGMNAVVLQHARVGAGALVAAGTVVLTGTDIPPGRLVAGNPGRIKKPVEGASAEWIERAASHYVEHARKYRERGV